ncbi:MAG: endopeptidase La [Dehalococcoidia bacterium]|nr:endopeptidase La [Dehalococcoidia bacterium]
MPRPTRKVLSKRRAGVVVEIAALPRRDTVLFPGMLAQLVMMRRASVNAVESAMEANKPILVVARKNTDQAQVSFDDLYSMGVEAGIIRVLKMPDGSTTVWLQGQRRMLIKKLVTAEPYFIVRAVPVREVDQKGLSSEALMRAVLALFEKCVKLSPSLNEDVYVTAMNADSPGRLADAVASCINLSVSNRQQVLETVNSLERLQRVSLLLAKEVDVLELQSKIQSQVQSEVDKSHREYFLREQMKAIQKELGEVDPHQREVNDLREKIDKVGMPEAARKRALEELERLTSIPPASPETSVVRTYLDWLVTLPWAKFTEDNLDVKRAALVLDENHYGLPKVKERILEYIAVRKMKPEGSRSPILCFVGPPGVGKTSLGKSIAQALGRQFVRVSLGGIRDEAEIRGHRRTYVGALPGRVIQIMRNAATINPVFMLDEVDKVGMDFRGDPSSALLEVLDPEQNHAFSDHYLEVPYNLSKVMFICTANVLDPILPALRDRLEIIELPGYTEDEKLQIAKRFLVSKQLKEHGLAPEHLQFTEGALLRIIREYTREAGVRSLERQIGGIARKITRSVAEGEKAPARVTAQTVTHYLGPQQFFWGMAEEEDQVGVATGVARTETGGEVLGVEVTLMKGTGKLMLTGQLGDVMKESAQAALSYARSRAKDMKFFPNQFDKTDIHIHVPAGAVPKDGPSAGITIATALISALTRKPVRKDGAMTGEITLRGRVLPVGGLKEKILAAHRAGIRTFVLPKKNQNDILDVPAKVRRDLKFVFVETMDEVLESALREGRSGGVEVVQP